MPRPRKGTEEVFYDTFSDWPEDDRAAALRVLEAIHRTLCRQSRRVNDKPAELEQLFQENQK